MGGEQIYNLFHVPPQIIIHHTKCFGRNNKGQLGLGDNNHRGDEEDEMGDFLPAVPLGTNRTAVAVVAEGYRTCVLLDNGVLLTF